ncbi:MAG: hypothetical protein ACEPOV_02870 [Hyphomicrobiales bacterium]
MKKTTELHNALALNKTVISKMSFGLGDDNLPFSSPHFTGPPPTFAGVYNI